MYNFDLYVYVFLQYKDLILLLLLIPRITKSPPQCRSICEELVLTCSSPKLNYKALLIDRRCLRSARSARSALCISLSLLSAVTATVLQVTAAFRLCSLFWRNGNNSETEHRCTYAHCGTGDMEGEFISIHYSFSQLIMNLLSISQLIVSIEKHEWRP